MRRWSWLGGMTLACAVVAGCGGDGRGSGTDISELGDATEAYCALEDCRYDYSVSECEYFIPFDTLYFAFMSANPTDCIDRSSEWLWCMGTTPPVCTDSSCEAQYSAMQEACAQAESPMVAEPFDGAQALCAHQTSCWYEGPGPGDPAYDEEIVSCYAEYEAHLLVLEDQHGGECADRMVRFLQCAAEAELPCDAGAAEEEAACPQEVSAYYACVEG